MTKAYDKALLILQTKGTGLTDADLEEIKYLTAFFSDDEIIEDQAFLYEVIEQVRMYPETKLSQNGRT